MKTAIKEITGPALRRVRESKGIKASWVAAQMGVSKAYISMLESNSKPWPQERIAQYKKAIGE